MADLRTSAKAGEGLRDDDLRDLSAVDPEVGPFLAHPLLRLMRLHRGPNSPFAGCYVLLDQYEQNPAVQAVMLGICRGRRS